MMNKVDLKRSLIYCFIVILIITFITISFNSYKYHEYTKNYNIKINNLVSTIKDKYPLVSEDEIINIINTKTNSTFLNKYGIDINEDSIILENNKLYKRYIIIDIIIITSSLLVIILIFIRYNHKKDNNINEITNLIKEINKKNYKLDMNNISEDELSILKNEIYKTTIMLKEQAENALSDKQNIKDSLSDISHQLKTPLTSILIMLDNIIDNPDMNDETRESFIIKIKREITNINFLIQNILKLSKMETNTIKYNKKKIKIDDIINEVINNISSLCDLKNITINYTKNNITIYADLKWQIEAITNIVKNGVEASKLGTTIEIEASNNKIYTELIIKDHGIGINDEDIKNIFNRFYRINNSSNDSYGIGLSLAKKIIEQNNGLIEVKSDKKRGTTFTIKYFN